MIEFWRVPIGSMFICNDNLCFKRSRSTGYLVFYHKTFYFARVEKCKIVEKSLDNR